MGEEGLEEVVCSDPDNLGSENYYINGKRKIVDFNIGLFSQIIVTFLIQIFLPGSRNYYLIISLSLVYSLGLLIYGIIKKRKYLFIGALCSIVIPLLALGACRVLLSGI